MDSITLVETTYICYDGSMGGTPDTQGRLVFRTSPEAIAAQVESGGATLLDTSAARRDSAGYMLRPEHQRTLDREAGFSLSWSMQLLAEEHAASDKNGDGVGDRAGFSVIVLSDDCRGVELGFWPDQVWAQDDGAAEPPDGPLFTRAEHAACDTTHGLTSYTLAVTGDGYELHSEGRRLLAGRLRDYTAFDGPVNPYRTPNFVFLGDDTSTASATIKLGYVALTLSEPIA